jgi:hypothetical protein
VLQGHEAFARLGDRSVVAQGLSIARELAGSDPAAQARVHMVANGSTGEAVTASERDEDGF